MKGRNLGIGVGLRPAHYEAILGAEAPIDWFEIISENFLIDGGRPLLILERILERYSGSIFCAQDRLLCTGD